MGFYIIKLFIFMKTAIIVIGIVILLLAALSYSYAVTETDTYFWGLFKETDVERPYSNFAIPLFVGGLVLIIIGAFMKDREWLYSIKQ